MKLHLTKRTVAGARGIIGLPGEGVSVESFASGVVVLPDNEPKKMHDRSTSNIRPCDSAVDRANDVLLITNYFIERARLALNEGVAQGGPI
jgi:hypothetical protein